VFVFLLMALVLLVVGLVAGWLLVVWLAVWLVVKRPVLSLVIAVYVALVVWLGGHDALALASYVVIVLVTWRLVHKRSFRRIAGPRLQRSWQTSWGYHRGVARDHDGGMEHPAELEAGSANQTQAATHECGGAAEPESSATRLVRS
jgi:hypothetical protein